MVITATSIAVAAALCIFWLVSWRYPDVRGPSLLAYILGALLAVMLICGLPIGRMLWLDFKIRRRLGDMARRVAAGEAVRASELRQ
jgi:peptidoglycan/LPS O-acetylase OafA/YrhL